MVWAFELIAFVEFSAGFGEFVDGDGVWGVVDDGGLRLVEIGSEVSVWESGGLWKGSCRIGCQAKKGVFGEKMTRDSAWFLTRGFARMVSVCGLGRCEAVGNDKGFCTFV